MKDLSTICGNCGEENEMAKFNTGPMANVTKGGMAIFLKDRGLPEDAIRITPKTPTEQSPYVHCLGCGSPMHYMQGTCPSCGRKEF